MPFNTQQFQIKTEAPLGALPPIPGFESTFHEPLSEPVRQRINPILAIALITSGLFAPVLAPETQIIQNYESRWHQTWSEPVRVPLRLRAGANLFNSLPSPVVPSPSNQLQGWYVRLSEPVRTLAGLKASLQQTIAYHPRILPPADITATLAALEINTDIAEVGVYVYTSPPSSFDFTAVNVSVKEVQTTNSGAISIKEDG